MAILNYRTETKWQQFRRWRWHIFAFLTVAAIGAFWWAYPEVRNFCERVSMLKVQRECTNFSLASQVWVYSENPADVRALSRDPSYERVRGEGDSPDCIYRKPPAFWDQYLRIEDLHAFAHMISPAPLEMKPPGTLIFLHERITSGGQKRIVAVWIKLIAGFKAFGPERVDIWSNSYAEGSFANWPQCTSRENRNYDEVIIDEAEKMPGTFRVGAGQPDPSDSSRFYFIWEFGGVQRKASGEIVEETVAGLPEPLLRIRIHNYP